MTSEITTNLIHYHIKIKSVLYPINNITLGKNLQEAGFTPIQPGYSTNDGVIAVQGDIGVKRNTLVNINEAKYQIAVLGKDPLEILSVFNDLLPALKKSGLNIKQDIHFYEFSSEFFINTGKNSLKNILKFFEPLKQKKLEKIMGKDLSQFSIRLGPKPLEFNSENYFEIKIEPTIRDKMSYYMYLVFRNSNKKITEVFLSKLSQKIDDIIDAIENPS